jgi:hypothetical protein
MTVAVPYAGDGSERLPRGGDALLSAIEATRGPKGRTVPIGQGRAAAFARSLRAVDPNNPADADVSRKGSANTRAVIVRGTTTSPSLTRRIVREGVKVLAAGTLVAPLCLTLLAAPAAAAPPNAPGAVVAKPKTEAGRKAVRPHRRSPRPPQRRRGSLTPPVSIPSLPRRSRAESQNEEINRSIMLLEQQRQIQQQNQFEIDQLRQQLW